MRDAALGTYDAAYRGCGNWPFNIAYASEHGLAGYVERFSSLADVERLVKRHRFRIHAQKFRART